MSELKVLVANDDGTFKQVADVIAAQMREIAEAFNVERNTSHPLGAFEVDMRYREKQSPSNASR